MARRIYIEQALRHMKFWPKMYDKAPYFSYRLEDERHFIANLEAPTIEELLKKIKESGYRVIYGKEIRDYMHPPNNAYEYILLTSYLKSAGFSDDQIQEFMSLD